MDYVWMCGWMDEWAGCKFASSVLGELDFGDERERDGCPLP